MPVFDIQRNSTVEGPMIVISANSCWNIVNFRLGLIRALRDNGYRITVVAAADKYSSRLGDIGVAFVPVPINSSGVSVTEDARLFMRYLKVLRDLKPFAYLGFTAKPNIYGSWAARAVGAKVINNVSGLGTVFIKPGPLTLLLSQLYRFSFRTSARVFFQNREDMALFIANRTVRPEQADLLPGSGVDLARFKSGGRRGPGPFRFLLVARLLWDKGLAEYVEAARLVRGKHPDVVCQILGPVGVDNRTAVPLAVLERWRAENVVEYLGESDDVPSAMGQADCIVLPSSYREGLPRALLEGSAMGKPLIATDAPGCRDVVVEGETGYLCEVRSADSLAAAMLKMLGTPAEARRKMGERGRRKVEQEFGESRVVAKYLDALGT